MVWHHTIDSIENELAFWERSTTRRVRRSSSRRRVGTGEIGGCRGHCAPFRAVKRSAGYRGTGVPDFKYSREVVLMP